jgi:hypothetical protein
MSGEVTVNPSPSVIVQVLQPLAEIVVTRDDNVKEVATYGIQGPRGNAMLSGFGLPTSELGINLDLYLDLNSGYIYRRESGVWVFRVATVPQAKTYVITEEQILSKQIILDIAPIAPTSVTFRFLNGTAQVYGEQYIVQGSILSWDGYSLDGFIEEGDLVSIGY